MIYKASGKTGIYNKDEIEGLKEIASKTSKERLLNIIYELSETENDIKMSSQKIIMFQTGIIKLCMVHTGEGLEEIEARLTKIENAIKTGAIQVSNSNQVKSVAKPVAAAKPVSAQEPKTVVKNLKQGPIEQGWGDVVNNFKSAGKIMLYTNLINTKAKEVNDMTVGIEFPNGLTSFGKTVLEKPENISEIEKQVSIVCGKPMRIKLIDAKNVVNNVEESSNSIENFAKDQSLPFNIIEE